MPGAEPTRAQLLDDLEAARARLAEVEATCERLRGANSLAFLAIEGSADPIFVKDAEGRYLLANGAAAQAMSRTPAEVLGKTDAELFTPEVARELRAVDLEIMSSGKTRTVEETTLSARGEEAWLSTKSPFRNGQGSVVGVVGTARNVTESKRAIAALRDHEERLRLAVRGGDLGFWDFYPQTGDCYFDERWFTMLGYAPGELASTVETWAGLLHPADKARVLDELQQHFDDPSVRYEAEFRLRTKSGDYTWILSKGEVLLRDEEGKPLRMAGTHLDIGERRLAQEQATQFHRVLERSRNEIYVFSATTLRFLEVNRGARENLGYSLEELLLLTPVDLKPEFSLESFAELLEPLRTGQQDTLRFETEHLRKDGSRYPVEVSLELATEPPAFVAVLLDISERKRAENERRKLEEQLKRAQRLESLGVLASGLAHDFNNLLLGIQGNTELARGVLSERSPAHTYLQRAETATRRSAELVKQMLACAGEANAVVEEFDLNDVVRELTSLLRASVSKKTEIQLEQADDALLMRGDPTQIRRIIVNLITNADQAIGAGNGSVTLATQRLEATRALLDGLRPDEELREGDYLSLTISDTGCGIAEDVRERIFDPFFTTKTTGSGLGLSAVHGIVRSHAGALELESEPGRGTTFRILLPTALPRRLPRPLRTRAAGPAAGRSWSWTTRTSCASSRRTPSSCWASRSSPSQVGPRRSRCSASGTRRSRACSST